MGKKSKNKHQKAKSVAAVQPEQVLAQAGTSLLDRKPAHVKADPEAGADYHEVRADIRRITLLLVIAVALLATAVIINARSSLLQNTGTSIAQFLQLQ